MRSAIRSTTKVGYGRRGGTFRDVVSDPYFSFYVPEDVLYQASGKEWRLGGNRVSAFNPAKGGKCTLTRTDVHVVGLADQLVETDKESKQSSVFYATIC